MSYTRSDLGEKKLVADLAISLPTTGEVKKERLYELASEDYNDIYSEDLALSKNPSGCLSTQQNLANCCCLLKYPGGAGWLRSEKA
jgi:hypothetical protein